MPTFTKNVIILCVTLLLFISFATPATGQDGTTWLNDSVSVRFQDEPMSTVLGKISQQTGIAILYDEKLADQKVTGHYKDIKFSEAINRLFRETNKSIQVFKNEKKIIVKTFGAKQFILASSAGSVPTPSDNPSDDSEKMTIAELEQMHKRQYKEYKDRIADQNEVLEDGITRGELKKMHIQQYKEYKTRIADQNEVLEGGMTRGELKKMHIQQYKEYKTRIADQNEVLEGGMTRGELHVMHARQYKDYKTRIADQNEVLEGGMTRGELKKMHIQQYKEYKTRIADKINVFVESGEMRSAPK